LSSKWLATELWAKSTHRTTERKTSTKLTAELWAKSTHRATERKTSTKLTAELWAKSTHRATERQTSTKLWAKCAELGSTNRRSTKLGSSNSAWDSSTTELLLRNLCGCSRSLE
jgi:hypothetical protein